MCDESLIVDADILGACVPLLEHCSAVSHFWNTAVLCPLLCYIVYIILLHNVFPLLRSEL